MIASCPQCAMSLTFDDYAAADRAVQRVVSALPAIGDDNAAAKGGAGCLGSQVRWIPIRVDSNRSSRIHCARWQICCWPGLRQAQPQVTDAKKWQRRRVLLCLEDAQVRETLRSARAFALRDILRGLRA